MRRSHLLEVRMGGHTGWNRWWMDVRLSLITSNCPVCRLAALLTPSPPIEAVLPAELPDFPYPIRPDLLPSTLIKCCTQAFAPPLALPPQTESNPAPLTSPPFVAKCSSPFTPILSCCICLFSSHLHITFSLRAHCLPSPVSQLFSLDPSLRGLCSVSFLIEQ